MKRTSFFLASLTAMALLSCSSDNLNPLVEDVNLSQTQALQKFSPSTSTPLYELQALPGWDEVQGIDPGQSTINTNARKCVPCGSMSASMPTGYQGWSSVATCDFTNLPSNARNVSYEFVGSGPSGSGLSTDSVYVQCGSYYVEGTPLSIANLYITSFAGLPANVKCYLQFRGRCYGNVPGIGSCSLTVSNIQGCQNYQY